MVAIPLDAARRNLQRLRDEAGDVAARAKAIIERAASGDEQPSDEAEYSKLEKRMKDYEYRIWCAEGDVKSAEEEAEMAEAFRVTEQRALGKNGNSNVSNTTTAKTEARYGVPLPDGARLADLPDASRTATLDDFGAYTRSLLLGESRAQSEGVSTEGGWLVPVAYSTPILDIAVNAMQVRNAGATVIPMDSKTQQVAKLESDPVPAWRAEGAAISESAGVFGAVTLTAKSLAVHVRVSLELLEDARPDFGQVLGTSLARAFALEADRVALYGSGTGNEPLGLKPTPGVSITNFVGNNGGQVNATNGNYNAFVQTVGRLKAKNHVPSGILYAPRTESTFGLLTDTTGQALAMPEYLKNAAPHFVTGQIPTNLALGTSNDVSDFLVGEWRYLLLGVRTDFRIMPLNNTYLVSNGQVGFVGWMRMDVQVARADAFEVLTGIRA